MNRGAQVLLWLAEGFGLGAIPWAPGTFGSLLGLGWFLLLLLPGSIPVALLGALVAVPVSVWLAGVAERALGKTDPGCVVIDEIIAVPWCFLGWTVLFVQAHVNLPTPREVLLCHHGLIIAGIFLAFRVFDVVKPWPVRQSQALSGGWGVTVDDLLAAVYVNLLVLAAHFFWPLV